MPEEGQERQQVTDGDRETKIEEENEDEDEEEVDDEEEIIATRRQLSGSTIQLMEMSKRFDKSMKKKPMFYYKQQPLLVMVIEDSGFYEMREIQSHDILNIARKSVPRFSQHHDKIEENEPSVFLPSKSPVTHRYRFEGTLQPRDIRLFDPSFSNSHDPEILVRRHSVLLNLQPAKTLVLHNKCFVFVPDGADSLLGNLLFRLRDLNSMPYSAPFEVKIYEAVFMSVCNLLETEYQLLEPVIRSTIKEVLRTTSGVVLERLRQIESNLSKLRSEVEAIRHAFYEVLQNDTDMSLMNLSRVHACPELYLVDLAEEWKFEHEEIELLLETYLQTVDGISHSIEMLEDELGAAKSTTTLRLSTAQNKLLSVELLVSSVTAVSVGGALVAAVFGMNLRSGVSKTHGWFWVSRDSHNYRFLYLIKRVSQYFSSL